MNPEKTWVDEQIKSLLHIQLNLYAHAATGEAVEVAYYRHKALANIVRNAKAWNSWVGSDKPVPTVVLDHQYPYPQMMKDAKTWAMETLTEMADEQYIIQRSIENVGLASRERAYCRRAELMDIAADSILMEAEFVLDSTNA